MKQFQKFSLTILAILALDVSGVMSCGPSSLNYQCSQKVCGSITLHWSIGGSPPNATNCHYPASSSNSSSLSTVNTTAAEVLHVALQTDLAGYVSMSFAARAGRMAPADAVIGWLDEATGAANVQAYHITGTHASQVAPDSRVQLSNVSALQQQGQGLTVCFSRRVADVGGAGMALSLAGDMAMNFAASGSSGIVVHSMDSSHLCSATMNWNGTASTSGGSSKAAMLRAHGALMITAWAVLAPLGVLAARHRHLFTVEGRWFTAHRGLQVAASLFCGISFIIILVLPENEDGAESGVSGLHSVLGWAVLWGLPVHLLVAFVARPKPTAARRPLWNQVHWWAARVLVLLAVINLLTGPALFARSTGEGSAQFYAPVILLLVACVGGAVWLELRYRQYKQVAGQYNDMEMLAPGNSQGAQSAAA